MKSGRCRSGGGPAWLRERRPGDDCEHAANEVGDPRALEQDVLPGRVHFWTSCLGFSDTHHSKRAGVTLTLGGAEGHKVAPTVCPGQRLVSRDSETAGDRSGERLVTCKEWKRQWQREQHENSQAHEIPLELRGPWNCGTFHKARRCGTWSKCPSKQEKPANARNEGTNFSRGERGGRESSAQVLNCHSDERRDPSFQEFGPVHVTNLKPSFKFLHLSSVSQRCGRNDIEVKDVPSARPGEGSWSWILFDVTAVQELKGPTARVHDLGHWSCGLKETWRDSFIDLHPGTLHRFWLKLLQGRCRRRDWRGHGLCRSNAFHERCWRGVHCWCWRNLAHCKRCCRGACGSGRGVLNDVLWYGMGHKCCVG